MKRGMFVFLLWSILVFPGALFGCELPAEPNASLLPLVGENVTLVDEDNIASGQFYFLVPEGENVTMKMVWDPFDHNGSPQEEEYEWVVKEEKGDMDPLTDVPVIGGKGFFSVSQMAELFRVIGNRGSIIEAFTRSSGTSLPPGNQFVEDAVGAVVGPAPTASSTN